MISTMCKKLPQNFAFYSFKFFLSCILGEKTAASRNVINYFILPEFIFNITLHQYSTQTSI